MYFVEKTVRLVSIFHFFCLTGVHSESYRSSSWIYISDSDELAVWKQTIPIQKVQSMIHFKVFISMVLVCMMVFKVLSINNIEYINFIKILLRSIRFTSIYVLFNIQRLSISHTGKKNYSNSYSSIKR